MSLHMHRVLQCITEYSTFALLGEGKEKNGYEGRNGSDLLAVVLFWRLREKAMSAK